MMQIASEKLGGRAWWLRVAALLAIVCAALALRAFDPLTFPHLPWQRSCGAITGLPCIFCGTTRALHHLLNGNFARALYFNWIAFPFALLVFAQSARLMIEIISRRQIIIPLPKITFTAGKVAAFAACVFALWIFQVSLAVGLHKHELFNPRPMIKGLVR